LKLNYIWQQFKQSVIKPAAALVGCMAIVAVQLVALPMAAFAADPLPAGKQCPNPGRDVYAAALDQCTYQTAPRAGDNAIICDNGYNSIQNTFECAAPPVVIPAPNPGGGPPTTPVPVTPPPTANCGNAIDKYDPASGLCKHGGPNCNSPYVLGGDGYCGTTPEKSTPGVDQGVTPSLKEPKCAVRGYGRVPCPINIGPGTNDCFVRDPALYVNPEWVQRDCNSAEFLSAATPGLNVNCAPGAGKVNCDPAVECATNCDLVAKYVNPGIQAASAIVGLAITASIILAGIQYASSADDAKAVSKAKRRILMSVLTLLGFFIFFAFLNWVVPGGI
jgi:hypothetical protein